MGKAYMKIYIYFMNHEEVRQIGFASLVDYSYLFPIRQMGFTKHLMITLVLSNMTIMLRQMLYLRNHLN